MSRKINDNITTLNTSALIDYYQKGRLGITEDMWQDLLQSHKNLSDALSNASWSADYSRNMSPY